MAKPTLGHEYSDELSDLLRWGYLFVHGANIKNTLWRMLGIFESVAGLRLRWLWGQTYLVLNHAPKRQLRGFVHGDPFVFVIVHGFFDGERARSVFGLVEEDTIGATVGNSFPCKSCAGLGPRSCLVLTAVICGPMRFEMERASWRRLPCPPGRQFYRNSLMERFFEKGISSIPATNPPTCAQKATPPLHPLLRTSNPLEQLHSRTRKTRSRRGARRTHARKIQIGKDKHRARREEGQNR